MINTMGRTIQAGKQGDGTSSRRWPALPLILVCLGLVACEPPAPPTPEEEPYAPEVLAPPMPAPEEPAEAPQDAAEDSTSPEEAMDVLAEGNTRFANDLYVHLAGQHADRDFVFSPFSISTALSMTYLGAAEATAAEMRDTLHFRLPGDLHHETFAEVLRPLRTPDDESWELALANRLWGQEGFDFLDGYLGRSERWYGAALETLDFENDAEGARQAINAWVEEQTRELIRNLIPQGMLGRDTRLVLTNAVYLKAKWTRPFRESETRDMPFTKADGSEIDVPFMTQSARFTHAQWGDWQLLDMPYRGGELAMTILLPRREGALPELEGSLDLGASLAALEEEGRTQMVQLALPKFRAEQTLSLGETLRALGIETAFTNAADFSAMTGRRDLFLSDAVHKAFIDVDEEGTEAAAATAVIMDVKSLAVDPEDPVRFVADHPFIYAVRHIPTNSLLFLGRVMEPKAPE